MNPFVKHARELAGKPAAVLRSAQDAESIRQISRRDFLKTGGVFVVGVSLFGCAPEGAPVAGAPQPAPAGPWSPDVYVSFDADGTLRIISHRSEMGQGIRTGLPAVLADEMEADWGRVVVEQATGDPKYGNQNTDGSHSVRDFMQRMRQAGATVRRMLEQSAANQWGVDVSECRAELHTVVHVPSGRALDFSQLVAGAAELPVPGPEQLTFKSRDQFRYIGKELPIVDMHDMTHGSANYGADTRLPGMKFAAIARPPVVFGKVKSYDASAALAVAGVEQVVEIPAAEPPAMYKALGGLAVIASNTWAALKGRDLLRIEWDDGPNADYDSAAYKNALLETVLDTLGSSGVRADDIEVFRVPGSNEIPHAAAMASKTGSFDVIIGLGLIIEGDTEHHAVIAHATADALQTIGINFEIPVINGIITVRNEEQAKARITGELNRGAEFAHAALEMAQLNDTLGKRIFDADMDRAMDKLDWLDDEIDPDEDPEDWR